ncbi:flavodoxin family protein [Streptomyces lusitanus]|uniref:Flavodoxin family protein n=1 Tax=Streptomyces lusitanus TaxID=68232 RepID=A0ABU3JUZ2_9ACTN|nr:flavodoxin family protein [Streptomyces lusitanus]
MIRPVRLAVVYHSATGTVEEMARELAESAEKAGAEVRLRKVAGIGELPVPGVARPAPAAAPSGTALGVPQAAVDDVLWADAVILGSPTRFGNVSAQLKHFLDSLGEPWRKGLLADKVYSAFTATSSRHGGQEATLLALITSFHHFGGIVVAPGYTSPEKFVDGNPYGTAHSTEGRTRPVDAVTRDAARVQARRVVRLAAAVRAAALEEVR